MRIRLFFLGVLIFLMGRGYITNAAVEREKISFNIDDSFIKVNMGRSPVLSYRFGDVEFKPYVKELYTPSGINVLLDSPEDHIHHHGLMYAIGIEGVDFWGEIDGCGKQKHLSTGAVHAGNSQAFFQERLQWLDADGRVKTLEKRKISIDTNDTFEAVLVTWTSQFTLPEGVESLTFDGRHYFGLGMRFIRSMDGGKFFNADGREGKVYRGEERLVRSRWCAYTAEADGKDVTAAMFDSPENIRHPATWFTMHKPFAYLSATLNLHEKPLVLDKKELNLCYAVALWDGKVDQERIDQLYNKWVKQVNLNKLNKQKQSRGIKDVKEKE